MSVSGIPEKLFYKIGEVCQYTDTQPYVLRFWESEFPVLTPQKNRSGQRVYSRDDIELVFKIKKLLYDEEYTIAGARKQLEHELGFTDDSESSTKGRSRAKTKAKKKFRSNRAGPHRPAGVRSPRDERDGPTTVSPTILGSGSTKEIARLERRLADMEDRWRRAETALEETEQARAELQGRCEKVAAKLEAAAQVIALMRRGSAGDVGSGSDI